MKVKEELGNSIFKLALKEYLNGDKYDLSVEEYFDLCLKLYKKLSYANDISIIIHGIYPEDILISHKNEKKW